MLKLRNLVLELLAEIAKQELKAEGQRLRELRDYLWEGIQANIEDVQLNGHPTQRLPHNLSIYIPGVESRLLAVKLKHDVALSTGSACTTAKVEPSHVILALGFGEERAYGSLRFELGHGNTESNVSFVIESLTEMIQILRGL